MAGVDGAVRRAEQRRAPCPAVGWGGWARRLLGVAALAGAGLCLGASAIDGFDLPDAETAARYQRLLAEFRCPKCLNESLASSGAPIAVDLRRTVRRLLVGGATDRDIRAHLRERFGDFVLYDPPLAPLTWLLWFSPAALAALLAGVLLRHFRRRPEAATDADRAAARQLIAAAGGDAKRER